MQGFRGGYETVESAVNAWTDVGRTFRAALVGNINLTPDPEWQYLSQFTANNVLVADATRAELASRTIETWNATNDRMNFRWTNKLDFGNPAVGQSIVGVITFQDTGNDATSPIWFYDDGGTGMPGTTQGGSVTYGVDGTGNVAGYLQASVASTSPLAGAALDFHETAGQWTTTSTFTMLLIVEGGTVTPNPDWVTLQDVIDAGVQFAVGAGGVDLIQPIRSSGWEIVDTGGDVFEFAANPVQPYTFPAVPTGQTIRAVLMYRNTGVPSTSKVWHWDGAFAPAATTGGDFIYGNGVLETITKVSM